MSIVHITLGAAIDVQEFLDTTVGGETGPHWPVRKTAEVGDRVVFLIPSMSGDFVAKGYVASAPKLHPWGKRQQYAVSIGDVEPITPPVSIKHLHEAIPEWDWTGYARSFTVVPEGFVERFWKALATTPRACDFEEPPDRYDAVVSRIIRDTSASTKLKQKYGFACQICGLAISYGDGQQYVETHHLRPLGRPHDGPDIPSNMLVLCPNHHAMFDLRVPSFIDAETVEIGGARHRLQVKHKLSQAHIKYYMTKLRTSEF